MKKVGLSISLSMGIAALLFAACGGGGSSKCEWPTPVKCDTGCAECCADTDCNGGTCNAGVCECQAGAEMSCQEGALFCAECCLDNDCDDSACSGNVICDEGECAFLKLASGEDCSKDSTACCPGLACDVFTNTCVTECSGDGDCTSLDMPFHDDLKCKNGVCDFDHCLKDSTCVGGKVCFNGDCVAIPDCSEIASCQVVPASAVTQQGTMVQMAASAYFTSGALAPGVTFTWGSDQSTRAEIDANGMVTGGADTGAALITATAGGCTVTCTADVMNYGTVTVGDSRIVVLSELENEPIEGASVTVGSETPVMTDANGVAVITGVDLSTGAQDVNIFKKEYNYVSMRGVNENDVIAHMGRLYASYKFSADPPTEGNFAGGIKGAFDFSRIPCEAGNTCDVLFGLGGLSIPGNLVNLNFDLLIGGMIKTHIELGGSTQDVGLPSGLTLCLNATCFKEMYKPTGIPGNRAAWGIGGKMNLADLIDVLGPVISGGGDDIDFGSILVALLPEFAKFYTAIQPNLDIMPIDEVVDVDDINDNNKTDDYVPDYDAFPQHDMTLKVKMDQTMTFNVGTLPTKAGGWWYDGVIVLGGVIAKDVGLIPLGISAGLDAETKEDSPDGHIDPITLAVADVAGRIPESQIQRVVIALALNMGGLLGGSDESLALGGVVMFVDDFTGTHTLDGFLTPPGTASYDEGARTLTVAGIPAASTYNQVIFTGDNEANWNVVGVFGDESYTLPAAPASGDRAKGANFISIKLKDNLTYQNLLHFDEDNMGRLVELVESFCFYEVPAP